MQAFFGSARWFSASTSALRVASKKKPKSKLKPKKVLDNIGSGKLSIALKLPSRQYPLARRIKRQVHLHIGPTNSGKSYTALNAFKVAKSGFYAGPLRMLAREIYDRMESENIPCNLITGDEILEKEGANLNSGTIEMIDTSREMDVAVIDEIQMISDPNRGWAWTRALLGVRANNVHLCGDPNSESIIANILKETGDVLHVHRYERLSPLKVMSTPMDLSTQNNKKSGSIFKNLEAGDCIVSFSKKNVQALRDKIVQSNNGKMCCSIIYGSLPPETRAEQARQFNDPNTEVKYLVASDAIGMGLNLGIKRIIFSTLQKFDGDSLRRLDVSEIKQIAGRAGRFKTANGSDGEDGLVTAMDAKDLPAIKEALASATPKIKNAVIMPSNQVIRSAMFQHEIDRKSNRRVYFSDVLLSIISQNNIGKNYRGPRLEGTVEVAKLFDSVKNLSIDDRMVLANAPVPNGMPLVKAAFQEMCTAIGNGKSFNALELFPSMIEALKVKSSVSHSLETLHKVLTLFLWLSYRFPCNLVDRAGAVDLKRLCEARFDQLLRNSRRKLASGSTPVKPKSFKVPYKAPHAMRAKWYQIP